MVCLNAKVYAAAAKLLQSCPTLCNPRDGSPPGSPIPGILQARTLEWGAIADLSRKKKGSMRQLKLSSLRGCCCRQVASVVSDSVRPHRRQPSRLPCPWDSPGKNTGVGCRCLLQCMKVKSQSEVAQSCLTPSDPMDCSLPGSPVHGLFQARVVEWVAIAFSKSEGQKEKRMSKNEQNLRDLKDTIKHTNICIIGV